MSKDNLKILLLQARHIDDLARHEERQSFANRAGVDLGQIVPFDLLQRTPTLAEVRRWVEDHGLTLHPEKTHIVDSRETSFSFLGYSFRGRLRFPRAKSHQKFVERIRELTPRKSGDSLEVMIQRINRSTQGWYNYFRHCHWNIFEDYDGMIRRRLRRMLLKRNRRNRKRLPRNQRWPNAFFTKHGFTSLNDAHIRFVQSTGTY